MAEISIILKAIDKYSGVITGLNSALSLVSKGADTLKWSVNLAFDSIKVGIDTITKGGNFREQESQLKNLADAYDISSEDIVNAIKTIGNNSTDLQKSMAIATKSIVSGLSGPDIKSTLAFVKKFTEATGGDFNDMSEQVFKAFSTGKFSILKQMGIFVEKGDSSRIILERLKESTKLYGEAAFNAGDNFEALKTSQADFLTRIGAAINDVPIFAEVLDAVTQSVEDFVYGFDTTPITFFLEFCGRILSALYDSFDATFGDITKTVYESIKSISSEKGFKIFAQSVIDSLQIVLPFFSAFAKTSSTVASGLIKGAGLIAEGWGKLYSFLKKNGLGVVEFLAEIFTKMVTDTVQPLNKFLGNNPILANALGMDKISSSLSEFQSAMIKNVKFLRDWRDEAEDEIDIGEEFSKLGEMAQSFGTELDKVGQTKFDELAKNAEKAFSNIKIPELEPIAEGGTRTKEQLDNIRKIAEAQKEERELAEEEKNKKKAEEELKKQILKQTQEQNKAERESNENISELKKRLEDIGDLKERIAKSDPINVDRELFFQYKNNPAAMRELELEETQIKNILEKINNEEVKSRAESVKGTLKNLKDLRSGIDSVTSETLRKAISGTINVEVGAKNQLEKDITDTLTRTNWPSELRALGEFLLKFIIAKARDERIPLVVSTL